MTKVGKKILSVYLKLTHFIWTNRETSIVNKNQILQVTCRHPHLRALAIT